VVGYPWAGCSTIAFQWCMLFFEVSLVLDSQTVFYILALGFFMIL
jgi:hypothetical protein